MTSSKEFIRPAFVRVLSASGVLRAYHRLRDRRTLTVFGLHRVLDRADPRWRYSMRTWTITARLFRETLDFVARHYSIVSLDDVLAAADGNRPLPPYAALVTFDDGWADTADTALPILREKGLPSVTFVISGLVGSAVGIWEAEWYARLVDASASTRRMVWDRLVQRAPPEGDPERALDVLLATLARFPLDERMRRLEEWLGGPVSGLPPAMVTSAQLEQMVRGGMTVGAHSVRHEPLVGLKASEQEIADSVATLDGLVRPAGGRVRSFSYPHSKFDATLIETAARVGVELQFTGEQLLAPTSDGRLTARVLGRVWVGSRLAAGDGGLHEGQAGWDYFRRPRAHVTATS